MHTGASLISKDGMKLSVEVIIASLYDSKTVRYGIFEHEISSRREDPDEIVIEMIDSLLQDGGKVDRSRCFVHSTSWRFEPNSKIVLTYFVYSDLPEFQIRTNKLLTLHNVVISSSDDTCKPRPVLIAEEHVVAHGMRHISQLVRQGVQKIREVLSAEHISILEGIESAPAGRI